MDIIPDNVLTIMGVNRWRSRRMAGDDQAPGKERERVAKSGSTSHHAAWPTFSHLHHHDVERTRAHEQFA